MRISDGSSDVCSSDLVGCQNTPETESRRSPTNSQRIVDKLIHVGRTLEHVAGLQADRNRHCDGAVAPEPCLALVQLATPRRVQDRKRVVAGKSVFVRVDLGGTRTSK